MSSAPSGSSGRVKYPEKLVASNPAEASSRSSLAPPGAVKRQACKFHGLASNTMAPALAW